MSTQDVKTLMAATAARARDDNGVRDREGGQG